MDADGRSVRALLLAVFVPVLIVVGLLASAVLGHGGSSAPQRAPRTVTAVPPAPPELPAPLPPPVAVPPVAVPPVAVPPAAPPAVVPPATGPPPPAAPAPETDATPLASYVPPGAERVDVGSGPQGAAIFREPGAAGRPGPVVIFLHGWVAIDPRRYGAWIGHLVRSGATVVYPTYQSKPTYDTITPLANVLAGVRAALAQVELAPGRLVVAGHSAGGALGADYAAVAAASGLPAPAAVFSVYPGRKLRHLAVALPTVDLSVIAPGTRVLVLAGERDTAVGGGEAHRIATAATRATATLRFVTDDAVDDHSAPRRFDPVAQRTFWAPLDALLAATAPAAGRPAGGPLGRSATRRGATRTSVSSRSDWPASQCKGAAFPWTSTTLPSRRSTAPGCAPGSSSTRTRRPPSRARTTQPTSTPGAHGRASSPPPASPG